MNLILDESGKPRNIIDVHAKLFSTEWFEHIVEFGLFHERHVDHLDVRKVGHQLEPYSGEEGMYDQLGPLLQSS